MYDVISNEHITAIQLSEAIVHFFTRQAMTTEQRINLKFFGPAGKNSIGCTQNAAGSVRR